MPCHLTEDQIAALALGVAGEETDVLESHLRDCPECRALLRADQGVLEAARELPVPELSAGRWDAMLRQAVTQKPAGGAKRTWRRGFSGTTLREQIPNLAWSAALLALVFGSGYWLGSQRGTQPEMRTAWATDTNATTATMMRLERTNTQDYATTARARLIMRIDDSQT